MEILSVLVTSSQGLARLVCHVLRTKHPTFTGFREPYEKIIEEARLESRQKNLLLRNPVKKVASGDPDWRFKIGWLSYSKLEYGRPKSMEPDAAATRFVLTSFLARR